MTKMKDLIRIKKEKYIKADYETAYGSVVHYGTCLITQERRKFLGIIPYYKTINIVYL